MNKRKLLKIIAIGVFAFTFIVLGRQFYIELQSLSSQSVLLGKVSQLSENSAEPNEYQRAFFDDLKITVAELNRDSKSLLSYLPSPTAIDDLSAKYRAGSSAELKGGVEDLQNQVSQNLERRVRFLLILAIIAVCLPILLLVLTDLLNRVGNKNSGKVRSNKSESDDKEAYSSPLLLAIKPDSDALSAKLNHSYILELQGDDCLNVVDPNYALIESAISELVKNAIAHGGCSPVQRESFGKPLQLKVFVSIEIQETHIKIIVADDGEGINESAVMSHAVDKAILSESEVKELREGQGVSLILLEGYSDIPSKKSSRLECTCLFDIYRHLQSIGGELSLRNRPGAFTEFTLYIPL